MSTPAADRTGTARCTDISHRRFRVLFIAGLLIRLVALPFEGTEDVLVWKTWSYGALNQGVSRLYGVGGQPPERGLVRWGDRVTTVDYPPIALYELAASGAVYRLFSPSFENNRWLNVAIKLPGVLAEIALTWLLFVVVARRYGRPAGLWAAAACWINPAMILAGSLLGYLDALMALPALGSIAAAALNAPIAAGALLAIACLTKLQAIFILPVVALALWNAGRPTGAKAIVAGAVSAAAVSVVVLMPYVLAGASRNVLQGVSSLLRHDMLSADAANVWWVITYVMRASYAAGELGAWAAWTMTMRILGMSTIVKLGYPNPRPIATLSIFAATAWALWRARRASDLPLLSAACAFIVHAYFMLGVAVHENHLYLAVPLLALAAAARPRLRPMLFGVSAVFALNLYLFFGFGRGLPLPPRNLAIVDTTVILALLNCALFVWHARTFSRECSEPVAVGGHVQAGGTQL
jgi:4-amino-4-deoxy-L-arabinose transferase-like glycosyltransferase